MGKRILVTGADGFIGRRLTKKLKDMGCDVIEYTSQNGDIASAPFNAEGVSHVFHLAAMTYVPLSWKNPFEFYRVNVMGTENILELCRKNLCSLTFMSSYIYGIPTHNPVPETHIAKPNSPYNHSKFICENLCEFYNKAFNVSTTVFRPFNVYGNGQSFNFLIPTIISQLFDENKETIEVMDLKPARDYVYIDDVIDALVLSIGKAGYNVYNIGSGESASVESIICMLIELSAINKPYSSLNQVRKFEIDDIRADISKIKAELSWYPRYSLKDGLSCYLDEINHKR
jgi:nucleoside-diphosphate-sugar epimerase